MAISLGIYPTFSDKPSWVTPKLGQGHTRSTVTGWQARPMRMVSTWLEQRQLSWETNMNFRNKHGEETWRNQPKATKVKLEIIGQPKVIGFRRKFMVWDWKPFVVGENLRPRDPDEDFGHLRVIVLPSEDKDSILQGHLETALVLWVVPHLCTECWTSSWAVWWDLMQGEYKTMTVFPRNSVMGTVPCWKQQFFFWVRLYQLHISKLGPPNGHRWRCSLSIERDLSTSSWNTKTLPRARGSWEEPGSLPWASGHTPRSFYMGVS